MAKNYKAKPLSPQEIEDAALRVRDALDIPSTIYRFSLTRYLMKYAEINNIPVEVSDDEDDYIEARVQLKPTRLIIHRNTLNGALSSNLRARFTLSHELGHLALHTRAFENLSISGTQPDLFRVNSKFYDNGYTSNLKTIEGQANYFAGCFLMPENLVYPIMDIPDKSLAEMFNVSIEVATIRKKDIRKRTGGKGRSHTPSNTSKLAELRQSIVENRRPLI